MWSHFKSFSDEIYQGNDSQRDLFLVHGMNGLLVCLAVYTCIKQQASSSRKRGMVSSVKIFIS